MADVFHQGPVRRVKLRYFPAVVLAVAAFGIWLVPGLAGRPEVALARLGLSLLLATGAIGLCAVLRR